MIINTPSGYEVHLREKLNFGQKRELETTLMSGMKIEIKRDGLNQIPEMDMGSLLAYAYKAIPYYVTKIVKDGKEITDNIAAEIDSWDEEDGEFVLHEVDKLSAKKIQEDSKKK